MTRQKLRKLDIEQEIIRGFFAPSLHRPAFRNGIERRVDLNIIESFCVPAESLGCPQLRRIPILHETWITPTRSPYADIKRHVLCVAPFLKPVPALIPSTLSTRPAQDYSNDNYQSSRESNAVSG